MDTTTEYDFSATVAEEVDMPMSDPDTSFCQVPGCKNPVAPYGGKGPRPKKCTDHKKTATGTKRAKRTTGTDYTKGITELLQLPAGVLGIVGMQTKRYDLVADAAVIEQSAPDIAEAVSDLANERPEVAAVLDRILKAGPYGALLAAVIPMTVQILANHKVIPARAMGTRTVNEILGLPEPGRETPNGG